MAILLLRRMKLIMGILDLNSFKRCSLYLKLNRPQVVLMSDKPMASPEKPPEQIVTPLNRQWHVPTKWDKRMFVWVRKYKSIDEVPPKVSFPAFNHARSAARIKLANYTMLVSLFVFVCCAITGKQASERGESIAKMNRDWHKQINETEKAKLPPA